MNRSNNADLQAYSNDIRSDNGTNVSKVKNNKSDNAFPTVLKRQMITRKNITQRYRYNVITLKMPTSVSQLCLYALYDCLSSMTVCPACLSVQYVCLSCLLSACLCAWMCWGGGGGDRAGAFVKRSGIKDYCTTADNKQREQNRRLAEVDRHILVKIAEQRCRGSAALKQRPPLEFEYRSWDMNMK